MAGKASAVVEMAGLTCGKLVVLVREPRPGKRVWWRCRCLCGREVISRGDVLRTGRLKSCGAHGCKTSRRDRRSPEIEMTARCWHAMRHRCRSPAALNFERYGGRGIKICRRWSKFDCFLSDMGVRPSLDHSIERINVDGDYEPSNCRWATKAEQRRNMRNSIYVEYEGRRMLLLDVVAGLGLNRQVVYERMKLGWSLSDALSVPVRPHRRRVLNFEIEHHESG